MNPSQAARYVGGGLAILAAFFVASGLLFGLEVLGDATTAKPEVSLAIITGAALAIERGLELLWTFVDYKWGAAWPSEINKEINNRVNAFGDFAKPYFDRLAAAAAKIPDEKERAKIQAKITEAIASIPKPEEFALITNDEKLNQMAAEISRKVNAIIADHPGFKQEVTADLSLAGDLADTAKNFLATFKDNPGRRVVSIYFGAIVGIVVATIAGVQIFDATETPNAFGWFAVPLTGVIMGLGANPTHEIIAALKKYKESKSTA